MPSLRRKTPAAQNRSLRVSGGTTSNGLEYLKCSFTFPGTGSNASLDYDIVKQANGASQIANTCIPEQRQLTGLDQVSSNVGARAYSCKGGQFGNTVLVVAEGQDWTASAHLSDSMDVRFGLSRLGDSQVAVDWLRGDPGSTELYETNSGDQACCVRSVVGKLVAWSACRNGVLLTASMMTIARSRSASLRVPSCPSRGSSRPTGEPGPPGFYPVCCCVGPL